MYKPLSAEFLRSRGKCCNNGCLNCPYKMNKNNKTGDDGSVGEELLSNFSESEQKCFAVYKAAKEGYFTLEEALKNYNVSEDEYKNFLLATYNKNKMKKILFFTGAGVSKESGVDTFRDENGLWHKHSVDEVASIRGWNEDKQKVIDFYNMRKKEMSGVEPNLAHKIIAELEKDYEIVVVTQNIDTLHEKAGSTRVIHLHGNAGTLRSEKNRNVVVPWEKDLEIGQLAPDGEQLRPNIVWFGEGLDHNMLGAAYDAAIEADCCVIVGSSMQVSPANEIPFYTPEKTPIYYVDPGKIGFLVRRNRKPDFFHIKEPATIGMEIIKEKLKKLK